MEEEDVEEAEMEGCGEGDRVGIGEEGRGFKDDGFTAGTNVLFDVVGWVGVCAETVDGEIGV